MYFEGFITVDPSQITQIKKVKPTKMFGKMLNILTFGGLSEKEEHETFTAVSILQQVNKALLENCIDNVVRISHDNIDFYLDTEGKEGDLKEAFDNYELELDDSMNEAYNQLKLVLEHDDENFKYLIEVEINKNHYVGKYPIEVKLTALLKDFKSSSRDEILKNNESIFKDQDAYKSYQLSKQALFNEFLDKLMFSIKGAIEIDDIKKSIRNKVVVPKEKVESSSSIRFNKNKSNIYYGYHGFDDYIFYTMLWSTMCHNHSIILNDTYFEDESGNYIGHEESMDTSGEYFDENVDSTETSDPFASDIDVDQTDTSSWSLGGDFDSGDFGGDSSCSSCSSCASCGGD